MAWKSLGLAGLYCAASLPMAALAQDSQQANRNAYNYAIRCFSAASFARERGIPTDKGIRAYDMAQRLGEMLGYTPQQTDADIRARARDELTALNRDSAYLSKTIGECQRLRLL